MSAKAKLITPHSASNFIPYIAVNTPGGVAIEPKPFPAATVLAMTLGIGSIAGIIVFVAFKMDAPAALRGVMTVLIAVGVFGPAVAVWVQTRYHRKLGTLLRVDAATRSIALPRESISFASSSVYRIALVSGRDTDVRQLQLHTSDGKRRLLMSTTDYKALNTIARRIGDAASITIETFEKAACDDEEEDAT